MNAQAEVIQRGSNPLSRSIQTFDHDDAGKNACEKSVQRTAIVAVLVVVMPNGCRINRTMHLHVRMMLVQLAGDRKAWRSSQRRRHDPRKLSDQKQADQHADKASYGP